MTDYDKLEQLLKEKQIPFKRNGNVFDTNLIFHSDMIACAKSVGLQLQSISYVKGE